METVVIGLGVSVYHGFVSKAIGNLYDSVRGSIEHPAVKNVLEDLDIFATLSVVEALLKDISEDNETIRICCKNLESVIVSMQEILVDINNETALHKAKVKFPEFIHSNCVLNLKWFANWRAIPLDHQLSQLRKKKALLDQRIDLLTKVLTIHHASNKHSPKSNRQKIDESFLQDSIRRDFDLM
eukprot:TRINITY_DN946_c0_g1_i2.p1 TRINITY_DN946_c0_g1~~TRINITY_DN946_c0_g1_i2.p1  ORF type:complete len:184 (+),score=24.68 TRINITY_DN946_c0_g1_i2:69-620(+)